MPEEEKSGFYCKACGVELTEAQLESGEALRRKGEIYCRECFRKEFPGECENHPGMKLTAVCSLCKRMYCENCVIEIQGQLVCPKCKDWALQCIKDGAPFEPPVELTDASGDIDKEWGLRDGVMKMPFWAKIGLGKNILQHIVIDKDRISALPFWRPSSFFSFWNPDAEDEPEWQEIRWEEISEVVIKLRRRRPARRYILIKAPDRKLKIYGYFRRFGEIAGTISRICQEKGIPCLEK